MKTGVISKEFATLYNDLFETHQESDYEDFVRIEERIVHPWISKAKMFVDKIQELLEKG